MSERTKTFLAIAAVAASAGVYAEVRYQKKLREAPPAASAPSAPGSVSPPVGTAGSTNR